MTTPPPIVFEVTPSGAVFTRHQEPSAIENGARVWKVVRAPGDAHRLGDRATVVGSLKDPDDDRLFYFVHWDDAPTVPVGVLGLKIARVP